MFELEGKYNIARVMLSGNHELDDETRKQIYSFLNHPAFDGDPIAIMPDTHAGKGAVIGFTMPLNDYVIPNVVGVDIGCGVEAYRIGKVNVDFTALDTFIRQNIPSGFKKRTKSVLQDKGIEHFLKREDKELVTMRLKEACKRMNLDYGHMEYSIGSLGGGNHFIEVGEDEKGAKWLTLHSGSRNFGLKVAEYHQNVAKRHMEATHGRGHYHSLEYMTLKEGGEAYLADMRLAQEYAMLNRKVMAITLLNGFFTQAYKDTRRVISVHNFIDFQDKVIRKGAIRAYEGEELLIPFNMEDGLIIGEGMSNAEWNYSAPHGAGRVLSRTRAKKELDLKQAIDSMKRKKIWTNSLNKHTLDEAKKAYKNKKVILSNITPSVKVSLFVKPVYNFKSSD